MDHVLVVRLGNIRSGCILIASLLIAQLLTPLSLAQHNTHDMSANGTEHVASMPGNDEVLAAAPESIMLHFKTPVRLVKLALKEPSQGKEPINIGFSYRPSPSVHFEQSLPELLPADFYRVEWAAFDTNETLLKGVFYFSFGDNVRPPSYHLNQIQHPNSIPSPDYRLL